MTWATPGLSKDTAKGAEKPAPAKSETKDTSDAAPDSEEESTEAETAAEGSVSLGDGGDAGGAAVSASAHPAGGPGNTIVYFDGGLRSEHGLILMRDRVGRLETEEDFDVKSSGPMFHVGFLTKLFWKLRIGASFGYGWNYHLKEKLTEFELEQEQEPMEWILGQVHTGDIRLEFSQHLGDKFWLVAMPWGGVQAITIGEDLKAETSQYEDSHVVRQGPQLGVIAGGDLGARYMLTPWFSTRLTGGYSYFSQGLLRAKRKGDAADSDHLWRSSGARVGFNLAAEASF